MVKYLVHSTVLLTIDLNPFQWRLFSFMYSPPVGRGIDAYRRFLSIRFAFLRLSVVIDNGKAID